MATMVAAVENPLTYTAREWDAEVGLYFYRARYYDPVLQRFISEDPIGLAGGSNPYAYVGNDPINARDPSGLVPCDKIEIDYSWVHHWTIWDCTSAWGQDGKGSWVSDRGAAILNAFREYRAEIFAENTQIAEAAIAREGKSFGSAIFADFEHEGALCTASKFGSEPAKLSCFGLPVAGTVRSLVLRNPTSTHQIVDNAARGITRAMLRAAIRTGRRYADANNPGTIAYVLERGMASGKTLYVSVNDTTGRVVTAIIRRSFKPGSRWTPLN